MITDASWNRFVLIIAAATLAGVLGFAYGDAGFAGKNCGSAEAPFGCAEFLLNRYQTLIGIVGAIVAAVIAARPVWQQFSLMRVQAALQIEPRLLRAAEMNEGDSGVIESAYQVRRFLESAQDRWNLLDDEGIRGAIQRAAEHTAAILAHKSFFERTELTPDERQERQGLYGVLSGIRNWCIGLYYIDRNGSVDFEQADIERKNHLPELIAELTRAANAVLVQIQTKEKILRREFDRIRETIALSGL